MIEGSEEANEAIKRLEINFIKQCKVDYIKYKSKTFYKIQHLMVNGAIAILNFVPAKWGVALMAQREIVTKEEFEE